MGVTKIEITLRNPTVQYGYVDTKYTVELETDDQEAVDFEVRQVHESHRLAMRGVNEDEEREKKARRSHLWDQKGF